MVFDDAGLVAGRFPGRMRTVIVRDVNSHSKFRVRQHRISGRWRIRQNSWNRTPGRELTPGNRNLNLVRGTLQDLGTLTGSVIPSSRSDSGSVPPMLRWI